MSVKTDLYQRWREAAATARAEQLRIDPQYNSEDYYTSKDRSEVYRTACELLAADDGLDHVKTGLRERLSEAEGHRKLVLADLINDIEAALDGGTDTTEVRR